MNAVRHIPEWLQHRRAENSVYPMPRWLTDLRQLQWEEFIATGLPTRHDERWKYTDLSILANKNFTQAKQVLADDDLEDTIHQHRLRVGENILLVFVNGNFVPALSDLDKLPAEVIACSMRDALHRHAKLVEQYWPTKIAAEQFPFASLNAAMWTDGLFFYLPKQFILTASIHLLSIVTDEQEFAAAPQHHFILDEASQLSLVEEYFSLMENTYFMNVMTSIHLGKESQLNYCKLQNEGKRAIHMANTFIEQMESSIVHYNNFSFGSQFSRDDLIVKLKEPNAACHAGGLYHLQNDNQYIDHHLEIIHQAPRTNSEMLYKGILEKKSRAVFNGRLVVEKDAQKIVAYQANHNLLLTEGAEIYSKPELEIYADDVKCKHGATTGQIDLDALFYLRSRGIPKKEAMSILLQGFAEEMLERITNFGVKLRLEEMVSRL